jgi:hypothetical protein
MTVDARIDVVPGSDVLSTWIPRTSTQGRPRLATRHQRSDRT